MANRAIWDVRQRHVWLSKPLKVERPKLRARKRCGLQAAIERKAPTKEAAPVDGAPQAGES